MVCLNIDNLTLAAAADSHIGCVRHRNDDSFAALPELGLFVLADGMGGRPGGNVASRMAVDALRESLDEREGMDVRDDEIAATLSWWTRPEVIVAGLIGRALERGAPDNVTCVVVRCGAAVAP